MSFDDIIAALREEILGRKVPEDQLAAALGKSRRSVQRMGLPFVKVGRTRFYDVHAARQVLTTSGPESTES
jgi:hypothetical protein